jgi:hypothetical protein
VRASVAARFLRPCKLSAISGFGPKSIAQSEAKGLITVGDVQQLAPQALARMFPNDKFVAYLADIAIGQDDTPVAVHPAPLSIGQSKARRTISMEQRLEMMEWLCVKLQERVLEDEEEYSRRGQVLTLHYHLAGRGPSVSRRCALPPPKPHRTDGLPLHTEMLETANKLLKAHLPDSAVVVNLGIDVSGFKPMQRGKGLDAFFGASAITRSASPHTLTQQTAASSGSQSAAACSRSLTSFFTASSAPAPTGAATSRAAVRSAAHLLPSGTVATPHAAAACIATRSASPAHALDLTKDGDEELAAVFDLHAADEEMDPTVLDEPSPGELEDIDALFGGGDSVSPSTTAVCESSHQVPAPAAAPAPTESMDICSECSQSVSSGRMAEHMDHHFAARVQTELRAQDRLQREKEQAQQAHTAQAAAASHRSDVDRKRKISKSSAPAAASMSLSRFLVPQAHTPASTAAAAAVKTQR